MRIMRLAAVGAVLLVRTAGLAASLLLTSEAVAAPSGSEAATAQLSRAAEWMAPR